MDDLPGPWGNPISFITTYICLSTQRMDPSEITYLTFGIVLLLAVVLDLGLLSKKNESISSNKAMLQTLLWISLALVFFAFLWYEKGQKSALEYLSAYLMEWSLSIDNIFLFILNNFCFRFKFIKFYCYLNNYYLNYK